MGQGFDPDQCCLIFSLKVYRAQITTMSNLILYFVIYHCLKGCFHFITNKGISAGSNPSQLNYGVAARPPTPTSCSSGGRAGMWTSSVTASIRRCPVTLQGGFGTRKYGFYLANYASGFK